jgi:hypothetical protein
MIHTKEQLSKLSLVEIKQICKKYFLNISGTKSALIKSILDLEKPEPEILNIPKEYKPPQGKKVIGIKMSDHDKNVQIGRLREKNEIRSLYYSMGCNYYLVDKDFNLT